MAEKKKTNSNTKKTPARKPAGKTNGGAKRTVTPQKKDRSALGLIITLVVSALLLLMLFVKDMAVVGEYLRPAVMGVMGFWGMALLPFYLINLIRTWYKDRKNDKVAAKWFLSALSFLLFLAILHRFTAGGGELLTLKGNMFAAGKEGKGAGVLGGYLYVSLSALLGSVATAIVCWTLFLLTLPLLFDTTPLKVLRFVVNGIRTVTVQVSDDAYDDGEELSAVVETPTRKNVGRAGAELREPPQRTTTEKKKKVHLITEEDLPYNEITTIPEQIEINRTRKAKKVEEKPLYKELPVEPALQESDLEEPDVSEEPVVEVQPVEQPAFEKTVLEAPIQEDPVVTDTLEEEPEDKGSLPPVTVDKETVNNDVPYMFPPLSLLAPKERSTLGMSAEESRRTSELLIDTLSNFGVGAKLINTSHGPTVTRFELQPDTGVRVRKISNLSDDIALHLAATSVRIEAPIPGKSAVGIEIPNKTKSIVRLRELLEDYGYKNAKSNLLCCLGMDVVGNPVHLDISKMPHLLIAGATGMGKSVCINSLIVSLLYRARPDEVKLILIDPKKVEFADYNGIPHLLVPVVTEPKKAAGSLSWAVMEMERRFSEIQEVGARNLEEYNEFTADDPEKEYIPQVVIVIDELADLMMTAPSEVENSICRLAQKARAAGMYLIIGTQRPSVDVITGLIKANIPSRIACKVASQVDSRTILDITGAEKLLGKGDMLYNPVGATKPLRVQGAFVEGREVISVCTYLKEAAEAHYSEDVMQIIEKEAQLCGEKGSKRAAEADAEDGGNMDPLELDALEVGLDCESISTSLLQRRLAIGYARAARIIDKLEAKGLISPYDSATKKRVVTISREGLAQMKMNAVDGGHAE